jgi:hypothetical protein
MARIIRLQAVGRARLDGFPGSSAKAGLAIRARRRD